MPGWFRPARRLRFVMAFLGSAFAPPADDAKAPWVAVFLRDACPRRRPERAAGSVPDPNARWFSFRPSYTHPPEHRPVTRGDLGGI